MIFKVVPFRRNNEDYDGIISVDDKYLGDTIDGMFERMRSDRTDSTMLSFGPFNVKIRPRRKR